MRTYSSIQGDKWDLIAFKVYGDEKQMTGLVEANPHLLHISVFPANMIIRVPEIEEITSSEKPPWMR